MISLVDHCPTVFRTYSDLHCYQFESSLHQFSLILDIKKKNTFILAILLCVMIYRSFKIYSGSKSFVGYIYKLQISSLTL